jgi:hypothetical protein
LLYRRYQEFAFAVELLFYLVERSIKMEGIGNFISMMDYILDTKRKRHIAGGILLSASLLFGGLSLTVMTIGSEEDENEQ